MYTIHNDDTVTGIIDVIPAHEEQIEKLGRDWVETPQIPLPPPKEVE